MLKLAVIYITFFIPFGPEPISVDFGAQFSYGMKFNSIDVLTAFATPFGYVYDIDHFANNPITHLEEIHHARQMEALGPLFFAAYAISPTFFEPYDGSPRYLANGIYDTEEYDIQEMWLPTTEIDRQFPQFRFTFGKGLQFLPGYFTGL